MLDEKALELIEQLLKEGRDVEIQVRRSNIIIFGERKHKIYSYRKEQVQKTE